MKGTWDLKATLPLSVKLLLFPKLKVKSNGLGGFPDGSVVKNLLVNAGNRV